MYHIVIQQAAEKSLAPNSKLLRTWAKRALKEGPKDSEVTIRLVGIPEMTQLNKTYRHKSGPTNVLSFPFELREGVELDVPLLGDVVICSEVVNDEAKAQHKSPDAHWAHMIVHGILHLLGFDHVEEKEAVKMEALEVTILSELDFADPYQDGDDIKNYE